MRAFSHCTCVLSGLAHIPFNTTEDKFKHVFSVSLQSTAAPTEFSFVSTLNVDALSWQSTTH